MRANVPTRNTILRWVRNFNETGSVLSKFVSHTRTVRTQENIERVRIAVEQSPQRSCVRQSAALRISKRSLRQILHDLKFHPYKIQILQRLTPIDKVNRLNFCRQYLEILNNNEAILDKLVMSDEAHFHLSGYVNKQNFRYWAEHNPRKLNEQPFYDQKVTVWCGVSAFGVIGPYFFEENN